VPSKYVSLPSGQSLPDIRFVQYTGRLMRAYERKTGVRVYDYADVRVPVLRAMHSRRLATYRTLGFTLGQPIPQQRVRAENWRVGLPRVDRRPVTRFRNRPSCLTGGGKPGLLRFLDLGECFLRRCAECRARL